MKIDINFLSKLSSEEIAVIKKQLKIGLINEEDMEIIKVSKYDINGFL